MCKKDLDAIAGIEHETMSPWSRASLAEELQVRQGRQLVVESGDSGIVGWCACRQIWPEAELLKIAVTTGERNKGVGTSLLACLIAELQDQAYSCLFLEVRAKNRSALDFYRGHGFLQVGIRLHYYTDPADDALILKRGLSLDK
jgi:ribosomal-protein-alanine N-acetyltransferase